MVSKDKDAMSQVANSFDGIIDTVSADHPLPDYLVGRQTRVPLRTPPLACRLARGFMLAAARVPQAYSMINSA